MIGLATIGQSPRDDVIPSMFTRTPSANILQSGALDGLTPSQLAEISPCAGDHPLVTRLRSGDEITVSKQGVTPYLESAVQRLEAIGATLICVLCTGEFDLAQTRSRIVYPDRLLKGVVDSLLPDGRLGIVIPHAGQTGSMKEKWRNPTRQVSIEVVSPYTEEHEPAECARRLLAARSDLIVLDCMGFTVGLQRTMQDMTGRPVILANRLVGAVLESMIGADQAG